MPNRHKTLSSKTTELLKKKEVFGSRSMKDSRTHSFGGIWKYDQQTGKARIGLCSCHPY
jgi:hypothetical protein